MFQQQSQQSKASGVNLTYIAKQYTESFHQQAKRPIQANQSVNKRTQTYRLACMAFIKNSDQQTHAQHAKHAKQHLVSLSLKSAELCVRGQ